MSLKLSIEVDDIEAMRERLHELYLLFATEVTIAAPALAVVLEPAPVIPLAPAQPSLPAEPAAAAAAEPAAAAAPAVIAEVDSAGLRWDERIHASSKVKNKDLTWRLKRNLDKAFLAQVLAEAPAAIEPTQVEPAQPQAAASVGEGPGLADTIALASQIISNSDSPETWGGINKITTEHGLPKGIQSLVDSPEKIPGVHMALQQLAQQLGVG